MRKTKDEFYEKLSRLVFPIMIQSLMLSLVSATDAIMLGLVDQTSLSAVSLAGQIQFILSLIVGGISAGTGIIAAQYWGKRDMDSIERVIPIALRINLVSGGLFTVMAAFLPGFLMRLFTNEQELIVSGSHYLKAVALSYLLCGISQIYLTVMKNIEKASLSTKISSFTVVLNIVLNALLIFGLFGFPKLGIVGAAYATVVSRVVELVWSILAMRKDVVRIRWNCFFCRERELEKDFWKYSTPVLAAALVWGVAYSLYSVIMGHMGSDAVAANSITSIAKSMISCLIRGISGGAGILIGNVLGAGNFEKAKVFGRRLTHMSIIVGMVSGGLLMAISPIIVHSAPLSEQASVYLQGMLLFCGINLMFQAVNTTVLDGIFCAGGDAKFDMLGNIGAMWCFAVPVGFLAAFVFKLPVMAVYCIVNLDEIVKIPAVYIHYKKKIWVRNITR